MIVPSDTPAPLTARRLASVRREAGASLFPDGRPLDDDDAWDTWAEGLTETDDRMARLHADLRRRRPRLARYAVRLLTNRGERDAAPVDTD